ncbi:MAG: cysteine desulfurase NifS [Clostridia bacterium]
MEKVIYVDHSATTYVKKEVLENMLPYLQEKFGNASSMYSIGRVAKAATDKARGQVASSIGCKAREIYFTGGGSESDNMILMGIARANKYKGNHIITTKIEHLAVLNTCAELEKEGFEVTYLDVDKNGLVDIDQLKATIKATTILISVMFANNEIGTVEPIQKIGQIAKEKGIYFHTDAVQAIGCFKINVEELNIDALSLSAHKFYGPKGVGAAYIKEGIAFSSVINGGHQERGKRAGTENVSGIVGLGSAILIANKNIDLYNEKLYKLREALITRLEQGISGISINGDRINRMPGNVNVSFSGIDGSCLLLMLDMNGICASTGSACTTGSTEPSHVLKAIGLPTSLAQGTLRITFGEENTMEDVEYIEKTILKIAKKLRDTKTFSCFKYHK